MIDSPSTILVIRRRAIGDVLVSMGVVRDLRERWPNARIDFVVDRSAVAAVDGSPFIDELLVYDRQIYAEGSPLARLGLLRSWLRRLRARRPDLVLDLMGTPQTALWTRATGAPVRVGMRRRWRTWAYTHLVEPEAPEQRKFAGERFLDWLRALDLRPLPWKPTPIPRDAAADLEARQAWGEGPPIVVLNPSATWPAKAWPLQHFAELARRLREDPGARVFVTWGPGEEEARDLVVRLSRGAAEPMPPTDLPHLAAHLARAALVVTTDSGPKHVAVGEGTPTLTLFGSTDPVGWQPPGAEHAWLTNEVPCRPCNRLECNVEGHPCLADLTPQRVHALAAKMLRGGAPLA